MLDLILTTSMNISRPNKRHTIFRQHLFNTKSTYLHTQWFQPIIVSIRSNSLKAIALGFRTKINYFHVWLVSFLLAVVLIRSLLYIGSPLL